MGKWNRGGRIAADIKVIQIPESEESKILDVGIRNLAQGIRNPSSTDKESGIQNPRLSWITLLGAKQNNSIIFQESFY